MDRTRPLASIDEVESVEAVIDNTRDHCLFLLGIQTGLCGSQLVTVRLCDARRAVSTGGSLKDPKPGKEGPTLVRVICRQCGCALNVPRPGWIESTGRIG